KMVLLKKGLIREPLHFDFVLGVPGGMTGAEDRLRFLLSIIPQGSTWSVAGVGRFEFPLAELAIRLGGNVRVGLEDNIFISKGVLAGGNAELVGKVVTMAASAGREIATPEAARRILKRG
ncbi:MAG: 3-keto-5-aminohexanoate cleavage protein, partial [Deltaproteobacteria bacterium]|nr:3-keto-5-aminohexanoate cleavage protein [Deltaproteobacteria bacterium]